MSNSFLLLHWNYDTLHPTNGVFYEGTWLEVLELNGKGKRQGSQDSHYTIQR